MVAFTIKIPQYCAEHLGTVEVAESKNCTHLLIQLWKTLFVLQGFVTSFVAYVKCGWLHLLTLQRFRSQGVSTCPDLPSLGNIEIGTAFLDCAWNFRILQTSYKSFPLIITGTHSICKHNNYACKYCKGISHCKLSSRKYTSNWLWSLTIVGTG